MAVSAADALELSISERIQLVTEIWESIAQLPEQIEITEETKALLIKRLEQYRSDPSKATPWSEISSQYLGD